MRFAKGQHGRAPLAHHRHRRLDDGCVNVKETYPPVLCLDRPNFWESFPNHGIQSQIPTCAPRRDYAVRCAESAAAATRSRRVASHAVDRALPSIAGRTGNCLRSVPGAPGPHPSLVGGSLKHRVRHRRDAGRRRAKGVQRGVERNTGRKGPYLLASWRRGRDSNPRNLAVRLISSQVHSTTLPPLRHSQFNVSAGRCRALDSNPSRRMLRP